MAFVNAAGCSTLELKDFIALIRWIKVYPLRKLHYLTTGPLSPVLVGRCPRDEYVLRSVCIVRNDGYQKQNQQCNPRHYPYCIGNGFTLQAFVVSVMSFVEPDNNVCSLQIIKSIVQVSVDSPSEMFL